MMSIIFFVRLCLYWESLIDRRSLLDCVNQVGGGERGWKGLAANYKTDHK